MPYETLRDFAPITLAKARPGELNYGSAGVGNATHLAAERVMTLTGIKMVNVPYKGLGPAITDLVGGHVQLKPERRNRD